MKRNCGLWYMGLDKTWVFDRAPHLLARTDENSIALLHPGFLLKSKIARVKKSSVSNAAQKVKPKYDSALDPRARRGTPLIALVRSLTTVPDSAFDPVNGLLRKEWLGEARPQLFFPNGEMQEYVKMKSTPAGFDPLFFWWLRGDKGIKNSFGKIKIQRLVCCCLAEVAREERIVASLYGARR